MATTSNASPIKRVPDMFLRALKRKSSNAVCSAAPADPPSTITEPKKPYIAPEEVVEKIKIEDENKENLTVLKQPPSSDFDVSALMQDESWSKYLASEFQKKYMKNVNEFLRKEYAKGTKIFPPPNQIFSAFNICPMQRIRVVIIGQDPYHNDGQAHGLAFSVQKGVRTPPSLKNMYKELSTDIAGFSAPDHGYLMGWAKQGVFLLNATLTVEAHKANSHAKIGWQTFTDHVIKLISMESENVVFLLWGEFAKKKEVLIDCKKHCVVKNAHPSPLSARHWWGSKCFSKANEYLVKNGREPVDWNDFSSC